MKETQILDDLDINLIAILRKDGRAPVAKLSQILGVSRGTVQNRLDRLLSSGAILGFTIRKSTSQVIQKLRGLPELTHMHTTNGAWDLIANIQTTTLTEFDRVLRRVRMTPGVLNSETSILLSSI